MEGRWLRSAIRAHRERAIDYGKLLKERTKEQIHIKEDLLEKAYAYEDALQLRRDQLLIGTALANAQTPESMEATIEVSESLLSILLGTRIQAEIQVTEVDILRDVEKAAAYYEKVTGKSILKANDGNSDNEQPRSSSE